MKALILAAGYATRLYPLTKEYPKPLLKVGKKPIIEHIIEKLKEADEINEIITITNSKFMPRFRSWQRKFKTAKPLGLIDDLTCSIKDKRGAIGDMCFAVDKGKIREDLLVIGADNLFDGSLKEFISFCLAKKKPVIGVYDIGDKDKARKYGVVKLDKKNKLVDFQEKPKIPCSSLIAMCLYYFPKEQLGLISKYLEHKVKNHDATGFYIQWLMSEVAVYGFVFSGRWYDIGSHEFYSEAQKAFVK
jgi:glucose-1-phosphate thymidylyltransferase